jgi:hypothetical protein
MQPFTLVSPNDCFVLIFITINSNLITRFLRHSSLKEANFVKHFSELTPIAPIKNSFLACVLQFLLSLRSELMIIFAPILISESNMLVRINTLPEMAASCSLGW